MKKGICGLLSLLLALSLCGCGGSAQAESGTTLALYFLSAEAESGSIYSSDATLTVDTSDCEAAASQLVNALLDGPERHPDLPLPVLCPAAELRAFGQRTDPEFQRGIRQAVRQRADRRELQPGADSVPA